MKKVVILLKTHKWSTSIETFAKKILSDISGQNIDFFILLHDDTLELYNLINPSIQIHVKRFCTKDIVSIYEKGFYSMWLSNHWILMWFYRENKYDYYWSVEYDVRISGNSNILWKSELDHDFLYPTGNYLNARNKYNDYYIGGKLGPLQKFYGYLQLARYSLRFLDYLNESYEGGENGQDELVTFSLLNRGGFKGSKEFLKGMIGGVWTSQLKYGEFNKKQFEKTRTELRIFHPVKE